jgi:transposase
MPKLNDLSRSLTVLKGDNTLIAVIEMSQSSWLIAGIVPGVERQPLKKFAVDESALLKLLNRWRMTHAFINIQPRPLTDVA